MRKQSKSPKGAVTISARIEAALTAIETRNPRLLAFVEVYKDEARAAAARLDEAMVSGRPVGPLAGTPIAVKDLTPLVGKRTTYGSLVYRDNVGRFDPVYVQRLRAAGAIIIGKTNTPEFAHSGFCNNRVFGSTRNPWNTDHTSGGSSGGAGAAVGAGLVPLAEGTDMGGSVRIPAAYCGTVGLKPSLGRIPMDILPTAFDTISHFGSIAATVEDAWCFLDIAKGPDATDPMSLLSQSIPFDPDVDVAGLRIALSPDLGFFAVDDDVAANLEKVAEALRDQGAAVDIAALPWAHEIYSAAYDNWSIFIATLHGHLLEEHRDELDSENVAMMEHARTLGAIAGKRIEFVRTRMWHDLQKIFSEHDALLCPTTPCTAPLAERSDSDYGYRDAAGRIVAAEMTSPFNFTPHCPACSVPSGLGANGLPTAAQIVGRRFDEATTLRIARAIERSKPLEGNTAA